MTAASTVGPKGQVVIRKDIRDDFGIQPGWLAIQRPVGDHVEIHFVPPKHNRSLRGTLAALVKTHVAPDDFDRAREQAWIESVSEEERTGGS